MRILTILKRVGIITAILIAGCSINHKQLDNIAITWEVISNTHHEVSASKCVFTILNNSKAPLGCNWQLYFSQTPRTIITDGNNFERKAWVEHLNGDWYRLIPDSCFVLMPGEEISISYETSHWHIKETDAPAGLYFVSTSNNGDEVLVEMKDYTILPFERPEQVSRHRNDFEPLPTLANAYQANLEMHLLPKEALKPIIPSPTSIGANGKTATISSPISIIYDPPLLFEANYTKNQFEKLLGWTVSMEEGRSVRENSILLSTSNFDDKNVEGYKLGIGETGQIIIEGASSAGTFYGIQSLISILPIESIIEKNDEIKLAQLTITDSPRFGYRGLHVDVTRHFMPKETILKVIDILAYYKINRLHLHLTDDEGWRLEIASLPELTRIGGQRGHTTKEAAALHPSYGSGPIPNTKDKWGSGFYTRSDFAEILHYANLRHIQVIPEINMPGHCRAAIKSMEARYIHFMGKGDEDAANEFRLIDPNDQSVYISAQHYNDNIVNVARESVYHFFETVVDEIASIYKEVDAPLSLIHVGGDEVPRGAWTKSPMIDSVMKQRPNLRHYENMHAYFTERALEILERKGLKMAGWEEIALYTDNEPKVNPKFASGNVIPYTWNSLWGKQDLAYKLANRGYPVVLCHVTNFYLDMAYSNHPKEPGLYWGGFVNTKKAWHYTPFDLFKSTVNNNMGRAVDIANEYKNMERLKPEARKNILGLQAQLWSETIQNPEMLEYYLLPKLIGFSESAWAQDRCWEATKDQSIRKKQLDEDWNIFTNTLGQRELPRLSFLFGGYGYRVPPPGATLEKGILFANVEFPGLIIKYTTDGSEPTAESPVYFEPTKINSQPIKLKAFDLVGKGSRTVNVPLK